MSTLNALFSLFPGLAGVTLRIKVDYFNHKLELKDKVKNCIYNYIDIRNWMSLPGLAGFIY